MIHEIVESKGYRKDRPFAPPLALELVARDSRGAYVARFHAFPFATPPVEEVLAGMCLIFERIRRKYCHLMPSDYTFDIQISEPKVGGQVE